MNMDPLHVLNIYYQAWGKEEKEHQKQLKWKQAREHCIKVVELQTESITDITDKQHSTIFFRSFFGIFHFFRKLSNHLMEKYHLPLYIPLSRSYNHSILYPKYNVSHNQQILKRVILNSGHRTRFVCIRGKERMLRFESLYRVDAILCLH
uniref:Uncharacterized protein n=1 Tax=viral metagenome TaxID=1070528 RepID=A0A6C0D0C8_9ZZZZ